MLQMTHNHMYLQNDLLQNSRFFVIHMTIINKNKNKINELTILEHVS
jgi:hypothetical protein